MSHKLSRLWWSAILCLAILIVSLALFAGDVQVTPAQGTGPKAAQVFGQADFTGNDPNRGGQVDANGLSFPLGVIADSSGGFYVADRNNHRVLYYANDGNTTADRVYGQFGSFTTNAKNNDGKGGSGAASAENLAMPTALVLDSKGGLYIVDRDNHRMLYFGSDGDTKADKVYGQLNNFTTSAINNDGKGTEGEPSADNIGLFSLGITLDSNDGVYFSDSSNNRVLYFANDGNTTADRVYGQFGNFKTRVKNNDGKGGIGMPNAENLTFPRGLAVDSQGGLYVADRDNHRVLYFGNDGDTKADKVYGQFGNFTTNAPNNNGKGETQSGAPTAENLFSPRGVMLDSGGGLYVADSSNNRVLYFANDGDTKADRVYGQYGSFTMNALNNGGKNVAKLPNAESLSGVQYVAVGGDGKVYVSDTANNRVLIFEKAG